jgi:hypothetical protein
MPTLHLVDLLMRKPLAWLEVLLLERRIQHTETPYLAGRGRIVSLDLGFSFAVGGLEGEGSCGLYHHIYRLATYTPTIGRSLNSPVLLLLGVVWGWRVRSSRHLAERRRGQMEGLERYTPLSCDVDIRSSPRARAGISLCPSRLPSLCL